MTRDWSAVPLIAHRCGGAMAPENSLAGLEMAAAAGIVAVEFDVMLTADAVPVVIHDETLERTTDGRGRVAEQTFAQLKELRCSKGWRGFDDERIPTLSQVLQRCQALRLLPNVEIKPSQGADALTGKLVARLVMDEWAALGGATSEVLLSSFSELALLEAQRAAPALTRALLFERVPVDWRQRVAAVSARAVHCAARLLDPDRLAELRAAGLPVRCYTVNDPVRAEALFNNGVRAVFVDALQKFTATV